MLFKKYVSLLIVVIFIISFATPVFAAPGTTVYNKSYDLDGTMLLKIQYGDKDHFPAEHKTMIEGRGKLERDESVVLNQDYLSIFVDSDWSVAESNLWGLTVTSATQLNEGLVEDSEKEAAQVFAVQVQTGSGEEGSLYQDLLITAASDDDSNDLDNIFDNDLINAFFIDQRAYTSGGEMKRYIDLVCPVSGTYIYEDSEIKGYADVTDSLRMENASDSNQTDGQDAFDEKEPSGGNEPSGGTESYDETKTNEDSKTSVQTEQYSESESSKNDEGQVFILASELFESTVLLHTPLEEVELPDTVSLTAELVEITGIEIDWNEESLALYDPDQPGSYIFEGEMIFPEHVIAQGKMVVLYTVHVVEELDDQDENVEADQKSNDKDSESKEVSGNEEDTGDKNDINDDDKTIETKDKTDQETVENGEDEKEPDENDKDNQENQENKEEDDQG